MARELIPVAAGCTPELDPLMAAGRAAPLPLADPTVSRTPLYVLPDGWTVSGLDASSTNGTHVRPLGSDTGRCRSLRCQRHRLCPALS
jgi:hypothetical protein